MKESENGVASSPSREVCSCEKLLSLALSATQVWHNGIMFDIIFITKLYWLNKDEETDESGIIFLSLDFG